MAEHARFDAGKVVVHVPKQGQRTEEFLHDGKAYTIDAHLKQDVEVFIDSWDRTEIARKRPRSLAAQMRWLRLALYRAEKGEGMDPWKSSDRQTFCPNWKTVVQRLRDGGEISHIGLHLTDVGRQVVETEDRLDPAAGPDDDPEFRLHIGGMATGSDVTEDPEVFSRLQKVNRKTIGVDMEAAAIYQAKPWEHLVPPAVSRLIHDMKLESRVREFGEMT